MSSRKIGIGLLNTGHGGIQTLNPTPTSTSPHLRAMETFEALRDQVSKITIYDIKSMYNQVRLTPVSIPMPALTAPWIYLGEEYGAQRQRAGGKGPRGYK